MYAHFLKKKSPVGEMAPFSSKILIFIYQIGFQNMHFLYHFRATVQSFNELTVYILTVDFIRCLHSGFGPCRMLFFVSFLLFESLLFEVQFCGSTLLLTARTAGQEK